MESHTTANYNIVSVIYLGNESCANFILIYVCCATIAGNKLSCILYVVSCHLLSCILYSHNYLVVYRSTVSTVCTVYENLKGLSFEIEMVYKWYR
jgi:hypothetical protein